MVQINEVVFWFIQSCNIWPLIEFSGYYQLKLEMSMLRNWALFMSSLEFFIIYLKDQSHHVACRSLRYYRKKFQYFEFLAGPR
jgi:hypothetical protein